MDLKLPAGASGGQPLEVAPQSQPMSEAGLIALAKQRRREAEEMEAIIQRRQEREQAEQEERQRLADAQARAEQEKREKAAQEARKWEEINARPVASGRLHPVHVPGFERVVIDAEPSVPMLVGGDLVITPLGITLEVFELVSPIVPQGSAHLLLAMYQDEAERRWGALVEKAKALLGDGPWLYTSALPGVVMADAGPIDPRTHKPGTSHKVITATWGDCYIHRPQLKA